MASLPKLAFGRVLTAEEKIQNATVSILNNPKFIALAGVLMIGKREVVDAELPFTARTNGKDEQYGREYVDTISMAALRFTVLHETYHKLFRHVKIWQHLFAENEQLAAVAVDIVVNNMLFEDNSDNFIELPKIPGMQFVPPVPALSGLDTGAVYAKLKQAFPPQQDNQSGKGKSGKGKSEKGKPDKGDSGGDDPFPFDDPGDLDGDDHDHKGASELSEEEKRDLEADIDQALRQGAQLAGTQGEQLDRALNGLLQPEVRWEDQLREFVSQIVQGRDFSSWRKPNRRWVGAGIYLPSGVSETIGGIVVAIDTSGSVGGDLLTRFMSEVQAICLTVKPDWVRVLYWDSAVAGDEQYKRDELDKLIQATKPKGGGGTTPSVVPDYMRKHSIKPVCAVVLTDGYIGGGWGNWECPVLWAVVGNPGCHASVGKTIHIKG